MAYINYLKNKKADLNYTRTNIVNIMRQNKIEKQEEKLKNVLIISFAICAIAVCGLIILF